MGSGSTEGGRGNRRGLALIGALVLVLLLVVGVAAVVVVGNRNRDAPLAAVRAYVEAIARGDAAAAHAAVDPATYADGVDPALAGAALASAQARVVIERVSLEHDADLAEDIVEVRVDYALASSRHSAVLRAQRADTGLVDTWRVLDPLLVAMRVQTNEPAFDTATLGGVVVPVSGPRPQGFPERRFFVYPGVYELRGLESRYLRAAQKTVTVNRIGSGERPADTANLTDAVVSYQATPELTSTVATRLAEHITACFADAPKAPPGCPPDVYAYADEGVRLLRQPDLRSIAHYQVDYRADGDIEPSLRLRAENGRLAHTGHDGGERRQSFYAYGRVVVTPEDGLSITFTSEL
ncbi:hypothetical protein ACTG9Q_16275 [Actinokineospora sp. 24-640]